MATYKVIQDIEAEDKFVGPLTLKQFIFAMAGGLFGYLSFFALTRGFLWALAVTFPPMLFGFFMAVPWSKDQPTDVWVLAKLRFRLKPKKRLWDQDGVVDLVTITAPKKEERPLTKNLSETEVRSRLSALATTIDSRGWVVKHAEFRQPAMPGVQGSSDRLVNVDILPQEVPETDTSVPDILEEQPKIDAMLQKSDADHKERIYEKMDRIRRGEVPAKVMDAAAPIVAPPIEKLSEQDLSASLKAKRTNADIGMGRMHSIPAGHLAFSATTARNEDNNDEQSAITGRKSTSGHDRTE